MDYKISILFRNVFCGLLHCMGFKHGLKLGTGSFSIEKFEINRTHISCGSAIIDFNANSIDPGLTPDGAPCGKGKMCVNQKCLRITTIRNQRPTCLKNCNGNGWCNNIGQCHCKDGFAPPSCDTSGPGGSLSSGPASDPNRLQGAEPVLLIIFLGIVPFIAVILILFYCIKRKFCTVWIKKPASLATTPQSVDNVVKTSTTLCESNTEHPFHLNHNEIKLNGLLSTTNFEQDFVENRYVIFNASDARAKILQKSDWISHKNVKRLNVEIHPSKNDTDSSKTTQTLLDQNDTGGHTSVKYLVKLLETSTPSCKY